MSQTAVPEVVLAAIVPERRRWVRWALRIALLLAAIAALWPAVEASRRAVVVPALSPFVAACSLLATRELHAAEWLRLLAAASTRAITWEQLVWELPITPWLGLLVGAIALVWRRWFCRWVCPTGLCADAAGRLGVLLGLRCPRLPPLGQWLALATFGGACLGYPLLLWLDPLAIFSGTFGLLRRESAAAGWCAALGLLLILLLSLLLPRVWCLRICPLGGTQDLLSLGADLVRWAGKRGQTCFSQRSLSLPGSTRERRTVLSPFSAGGESDRRLARRTVLGLCGGLIGAAAAAAVAAAVRVARASAPRALRPPGAIEEPEFLGVCIRCGNCLRACPSKIIEPDPGHHGIASLLSPVLRFQQNYCLEDCARCTDVCPSGALKRLSLAGKRLWPIGLPQVDMEVCLLGDDRECAICRNHCPYEAIALVFSEESYTLTPQIDPQKCPGCGACEAACPTAPLKAIVVRPIDGGDSSPLFPALLRSFNLFADSEIRRFGDSLDNRVGSLRKRR